MKETNELLAEFFKDVFNKDVFLPDNIDLYSVLSILEIDMFKDWCNEKNYLYPIDFYDDDWW